MIESKLCERWSPEQIVGPELKGKLSFKTIYNWLYKNSFDVSLDVLRRKGKTAKTKEILSNRINEVMKYLEQTKEYMGVLYSLYNELEVLYKIKILKKEGKQCSSNYNTFKIQFEKVKEAFKINNRIPNSYAIFKKLELEKNYSLESLKKLVYRSWEIENSIKTGKIEMRAGFETLIMHISSLYKIDCIMK